MREGGVEPPRPCGHWNLNPARLPIPPPAHWVCLPSPALPRAPSDMQKISTLPGVESHPFPPPLPPALRPHRRPGRPRPARARRPCPARPRGRGRLRVRRRPAPHLRPGTRHTFQREPVHVSTSYRSSASPQESDGPHSQVRDTGPGAPLRSMAEAVPGRVRRGASQGTSGGDFGRCRQPVDRADRGNQPISRRVDTISKQYQQGRVGRLVQQGRKDDSKLYQDGNDGGGAPWES